VKRTPAHRKHHNSRRRSRAAATSASTMPEIDEVLRDVFSLTAVVGRGRLRTASSWQAASRSKPPPPRLGQSLVGSDPSRTPDGSSYLTEVVDALGEAKVLAIGNG